MLKSSFISLVRNIRLVMDAAKSHFRGLASVANFTSDTEAAIITSFPSHLQQWKLTVLFSFLNMVISVGFLESKQ